MNANLVLNSTRLNPADNERVEIFLVTFDREDKNRFREVNRQKKRQKCVLILIWRRQKRLKIMTNRER